MQLHNKWSQWYTGGCCNACLQPPLAPSSSLQRKQRLIHAQKLFSSAFFLNFYQTCKAWWAVSISSGWYPGLLVYPLCMLAVIKFFPFLGCLIVERERQERQVQLAGGSLCQPRQFARLASECSLHASRHSVYSLLCRATVRAHSPAAPSRCLEDRTASPPCQPKWQDRQAALMR